MTLLVALGALLGAPARYLVDVGLSRRLGNRLPWGILVVNLVGSAAAGLLVGASASDRVDSLVGLGFLGSFTTASTLAWDVLAVAGRSRREGALLLALHVVPGLALAGLGFAAGRAL